MMVKAKPSTYYDEAYYKTDPAKGYIGDYTWDSAPWERISRCMVRSFGCTLGANSVIDFACAHGYVMWFLKHAFGWHVKGYDFSEYAVAHHVPDVDVELADMTKKQEYGLADITLCMDALEHIEEKKLPLALANIHRSTGMVFVAHVAITNSQFENYALPEHITMHDKQWWTQLFHDNGFVTHSLEPYYTTMIKRLVKGRHSTIWSENAFVLQPVKTGEEKETCVTFTEILPSSFEEPRIQTPSGLWAEDLPQLDTVTTSVGPEMNDR